MNFRKKTIGPSWDQNYNWIAVKRGHTLKIKFDVPTSTYSVYVFKDDQEIHISDDLLSLEAAEKYAESWALRNITMRIIKRPRISLEKKYNLLIENIDRLQEKYPDEKGLKELKAVIGISIK